MHARRKRRWGDPLKVRPRWFETFWTHVEVTGFCWNWTGSTFPSGYGAAASGRGARRAHRVGYELLVGSIPDGMQIDHLCRNLLCVNPDHLDVCDARTNTLRSFNPSAVNARKTHCSSGHEFTVDNTYVKYGGSRRCRTCIREDMRRRRSTRAVSNSTGPHLHFEVRVDQVQVSPGAWLRERGIEP